ncbi:MAG: bifunctional phosphopantothenoylcysteine decarboxylase/phosphopantothenate--cysteine ligase CoaBC [Myxococcota bacterium]
MSRILIGVSGGIAAYKACALVRQLVRRGDEVRVVATRSALEFVSPLTLQALSGHPVRSDLFAPGEESQISHIELADWAEAFLVAPATAHVLARFAHGLADDLVTTVLLATRARVLVAPAMNVHMLEHPATQANLDLLAKRGVRIVGPESGELACGWEGAGRMVEVETLVHALQQSLARPSLAGHVVLITAGPTSEAIDPVRVITNRSSGKMGFALAAEAARRGAEVILVAGPVAVPTPPGVERIDVESAAEMREAVLGMLERATIVIKAAAVADYRVARRQPRKLEKQGERMQLELVRNPDICAEVGRRKGGRLLVGFAAETHDLLAHAREKLVRKGCDLIVANDVSSSQTGIGADDNEVTIVGPGPDDLRPVAAAPKPEVAARIFDRIEELCGP